MIVQEREKTYLDIQEHALDMQKAEFTRSETMVYSVEFLFGFFSTADFSLCIQWEYGGALRDCCIRG